MNTDDTWSVIEATLAELVAFQQKRLLACGRQIIPHLTSDDMLQPNDFPQLENDPIFRYEEGILAGIQSSQIALRAKKQELSK